MSTVKRRIVPSEAFVHQLTSAVIATDDFVWLNRTERGQRYTLPGVPAKQVDVAIVPGSLESKHGPMVELGEKRGKFDGAVRLRITLRFAWPRMAATGPAPEKVGLELDIQDRLIRLIIGGEEAASWKRLRDDLRPGGEGRIIWWHYNRWYQFLPEEEVELLAAAFSPSGGLAEANREASRQLYRLARDLGWRKLTMRERRKLGLESAGQWVPEHVYAHAQSVAQGHPTGCSEATIDAARGLPWAG